MIPKQKNTAQTQFLAPTLKELLDPKHPLYKLAHSFPWDKVDAELISYYKDFGRPAKPIRLMVSLLLLKQMFNLGDETVVEQWVQNPYFQYFSGEELFQWNFPCDPSDLVHFRKRIGSEGLEFIFGLTIQMHGKAAREKELIADTTVQEKNITYPTDVKLAVKIIKRCNKIAKKESLPQRQTYTRTVKHLMLKQRFRSHPKRVKEARRAERKLKTIAGRLYRELLRNMSNRQFLKYGEELEIFNTVLQQKRHDKDKIYSLHEPDVYCISKGKDHKKYEYGCKTSFLTTKTSGIIVGALSFEKNIYDGHSILPALQQYERITDANAKTVYVDRGYRGIKRVGETQIIMPTSKEKDINRRAVLRKAFRRRAAIEPVIGHLKSQYRLCRNHLKGISGDRVNALLAASAFNLIKWMRVVFNYFYRLLEWVVFGPNLSQQKIPEFKGTF